MAAHRRYGLTEFAWKVIKPLCRTGREAFRGPMTGARERYFLSAKLRLALSRFVREIWVLHDGLQSLQPLAESRSVIPPKSTRREEIPFSKRKCKKRNLAERCFNKLKQFWHIATRYDSYASAYLAFAKLDAIRF